VINVDSETLCDLRKTIGQDFVTQQAAEEILQSIVARAVAPLPRSRIAGLRGSADHGCQKLLTGEPCPARGVTFGNQMEAVHAILGGHNRCFEHAGICLMER